MPFSQIQKENLILFTGIEIKLFQILKPLINKLVFNFKTKL